MNTPVHSRALVDTSAFYALISSSDDFQPRARRLYEYLIDRETELYASSYVMVETAALVHHRLGFSPLKTFMDSIEGIVKIYWVDQATHSEAWKMQVSRDGKGLSLVDWTSVILAKKLNASVFAFDDDLVKEAVTVIS